MTRLEIRNGGKGAVRLPKILVLTWLPNLAQAIRVLCEYCAFEFEARHSPFSPTLACVPFFSLPSLSAVSPSLCHG